MSRFNHYLKKLALPLLGVLFLALGVVSYLFFTEYREMVKIEASNKQYEKKIQELDLLLEESQEELDLINAESDVLMASDVLLDEKIRQLKQQVSAEQSSQLPSDPNQDSSSELNGVSQ